jgi:hypothetical protein
MSSKYRGALEWCNCPCSHFSATTFFLGKTATLCDGAVLRYVCVCCIAFLKSSSLTMLYLSKMARVLWPDTAIAKRSGTPARTMFLSYRRGHPFHGCARSSARGTAF